MTEKSILHSHKYQGCSVGMVLAREKKHLAWLYYNITSVNFMPEILDEIGITEGIRIAKPGANGRIYGLWSRGRRQLMSEDEYMHTIVHERAVSRYKARDSEKKSTGGSKARHKAFQQNKMAE